VHRYSGDADAAIAAYDQAALMDPTNFWIAKDYGLYLEQLGQGRMADPHLRRAYALNSTDEDVAAALRRLNVVPGPSLKEQQDLVNRPVPKGPIPPIDMSKIGLGGRGNQSASPPSELPPPEPSELPPPAEPAGARTPRD
jgi:tetratricopeptide (TPR) repeat protein